MNSAKKLITQTNTNLQTITRILSPLSESTMLRRVALRAMISPFFSGVFSIIIVAIIQHVINAVQDGDTLLAQYYLRYFISAASLWFGLRIITRNRGYSEFWPFGHHYFYQTYLKKYISLNNNIVESIGTGRIQHILDTGVNSRIFLLSDIVIKFSKFLSKIVFGLVLVFSVSVIYGLSFVGLMIAITICYIYTQNKANVYRRERKTLLVERSRDIIRIIMSKFEILQSGKLTTDLQKYDNRTTKRYAINRHIETQRTISESFSSLVIDVLKACIIISIVYSLWGATISIGSFVSLMMIATMLDDITWDISKFYIDSAKQFINVEKLRDLFDNNESLCGYETGEKFVYKHGDIEIKNLCFGYDKHNNTPANLEDENPQNNTNTDKSVFTNFNLNITGGQKIALVGSSGSGKTTLVKLISGYIRPHSGSILIDGQDLQDVSLQSFYKHIGYLTQEPSVFDGSIYDNLAYAIENKVSEEAMKEALLLAKCEFVLEFAEGLQTQIGERGLRPSGGQRPRLAIAKVFLKNPEIVILDEPTSALDSFAEETITQAMHNLFANRTVIIIAHRLQTVKHADDIIVLEQGKVIERGTHDELVALGQRYAKMLELQSGF